MSSIGDALVDILASVQRPGDFCVGEEREVIMPAIEVDEVGPIAFPILPGQARLLIDAAAAAPYGRGSQTLVDRDVRRTWQIDAGKVRVGGRRWSETLAGLVARATEALGVGGPVAAELYKLLVYDEGSFFVEHRDTEKMPGMFATLTVVLPSQHEGGELVVRHLGREVVLDLRPREPSEIGIAAFYGDCVHEMRPVTSGCRVALIYNLGFSGGDRVQNAPDYRSEEAGAAELLGYWAEAADEPDKLILPLEHAYTPAELSFATLKGADAGIAAVLAEAAATADCELHLALVSIEESGSAFDTGGYGYRRQWDDDGDEEDFEIDEVSDRYLFLSDWQRPDGTAAALGQLPFDEDEVCPPDALEDMTPDEQHFHEATGNAGASFERTYRHAGLVLWPRARRLAVLSEAGLAATLPWLEDLTARWEASGADTASPLWHEAGSLSKHMLRSTEWSWVEGDTRAGLMLNLQARLGNAAHVETFLAGQSAEGRYRAGDNAAIVRAAKLLPRARATELFVRILQGNAPAQLAACGDLLLRLTAEDAPPADLHRLGATLVDLLPGDPKQPAEYPHWQRRQTVTPGFVVDLATALSRIDAGAGAMSLADRAVSHVLAWPQQYGADEVLVPAALALAEMPENADRPAARRLREAALDHLRQRIAEPLTAPSDWSRDNPLTCPCEACRNLGAFLADPDQRIWYLKAAENLRAHVEQSARDGRCDLDCTTTKSGRPYTLVATKNQASYDRRARQRQEDLTHLAALDGLRGCR